MIWTHLHVFVNSLLWVHDDPENLIKGIKGDDYLFFRGDALPHDSVQSVTIQGAGAHTYIFALCKDLKIRIWCCQVKYFVIF